jgi:hypothetical protein
MFLAHMQAPPISPSQRSELLIPSEVDDLVLACLEKDPAKRPQSALELLRMVRQCRSSEGWDHDTARGWWQTHLPELTGALTVADGFAGADRALAVVGA